MSRVFVTLDETNPLKPVTCLHVNGQELRMSEAEAAGLMSELGWVLGHLSAARKVYYKSLACKYKEVRDDL